VRRFRRLKGERCYLLIIPAPEDIVESPPLEYSSTMQSLFFGTFSSSHHCMDSVGPPDPTESNFPGE